MITVKIWLKETSQPIEKQAMNTYQKGDMFVVYLAGGTVDKIPMANIWMVQEDYGKHTSSSIGQEKPE